MCCYSALNPQVLLYDGHEIHFDDMELEIICRHNIQYFILKAGNYVHDHPKDNGPNMKINNLYGNAIMNWMRHHGTLKFTRAHMNSVLIETWEAFRLSPVTINQKGFKKTHLLPLDPPDIVTNHQSCIAGTQNSNREKEDEIGCISKAIIFPIYMEEVRTTDPMVILREKIRCRTQRNLLIRAAEYDTASTRPVIPNSSYQDSREGNEET